MDAIVKIFGVSILVVGALFVTATLGTLMGGVAGWVVGYVFEDSIAALKAFAGLEVTDFQLGAMLGFVGGFFKSSTTVSGGK